MKRSTIIIIIILVLAIIVPVIFIAVIFSGFTSDVKELAASEAAPRGYVVVVNDSEQTHAVSLDITTDKENRGIFSSVNVQSDCGGIATVISSDTIYIDIDTLHTNETTPCPIAINLPDKSSMKLHNSSSAVSVKVKDANLERFQVATAGELSIADSNVGMLLSIDSVSYSSINIVDSNIGAANINGQNKTIDIDSSNLGAIAVSGDCVRINAADCNVGVATWNKATQNKFYSKNSVFVSRINEEVENVVFDDSNVSDSTAYCAVKGKNGEIVNVSKEGVHVESGSDKVNITPSKVFVSSGTDTVKVSPAGVQVKSGSDKVSIGVGGIKVN